MKLEGFLSLACGIVALVAGFITFSVEHPSIFYINHKHGLPHRLNKCL